MSFLGDVSSNSIGCLFTILSFICGLLAMASVFLGGFVGTNSWLGFGIFIVLAIIFFGISRAFSRRG